MKTRDDGAWGDGRSPLGRELLRAGRSERAGASACQLAEAAMVMAPVGASGAAAGVTAAKAGAWAANLKWMVVVVAALVAGGGSVALWNHRGGEHPSRAPRASKVALPAPSAPSATVTAHEPASAVAEAASPAPVLAVEPAEKRARRPPKPIAVAAGATVVPVPPADPRLAHELAVLTQARAALAAGTPERALALLDPAPGAFQLLALEASVLRAGALRASGRLETARALAQELLRQHPAGPYSQRLRALAGR